MDFMVGFGEFAEWFWMKDWGWNEGLRSKRSGILEKDRKKIQFDRKDQNDPKRIHARVAVLTAPRRQGRRTEFGLLFFVLCVTGYVFIFGSLFVIDLF
ncbi:hypothetical protein RCS94_09230 [Orbaceae bacterium ac157xtp]